MSEALHKGKEKKVVDLFHNPMTAWVVLLCGFMVTAAAWYVSTSAVLKRAEERFDRRVAEIQSSLEDRMNLYEQVLWGGVGLFNSTKRLITREEFRLYVETLQLEKHWPGIQGMGFSIPVPAEALARHIAEVRAEGFPEFTVKPEGPRDEYSSIIYLEPFDWRNKRAFGYDMWSNEMRRTALARARDTGEAATSGLITLVQETEEDVQKGFLTYLPVYSAGQPVETLTQRQNALVGWVYAAFRMGDLMKGVSGSRGSIDSVNYEIYDGEQPVRNSLLFDSNQGSDLFSTSGQNLFSKMVEVEMQGRKWHLFFTAQEDFISNADKRQPLIIASIGVFIDLLLFYIISALVFLQRKARKLADGMTQELSEAKEFAETAKTTLEVQLQDLERKNAELQQLNDITVGREQQMVMLKQEVNKLSAELGRLAPYDLSFADSDGRQ